MYTSSQIGRPLPVEYLLIDVPVTVPKEVQATFSVLEGDRKHFPIENRPFETSLQVEKTGAQLYRGCYDGILFQDFNSFASYMSQFRSAEFLSAVSDLHVLVFMASLDIVPLRYTTVVCWSS